jgi:hypothetical protein
VADQTPPSRQLPPGLTGGPECRPLVIDHDCGECGHHRLRHDKPGGLCGEIVNDVWGDPIPCDCIEFEEPA